VELNTHLSFDGQCEAAFRFYAKCLKGKLAALMTYGESPMAAQTPARHHKRILHATLTVGARRLTGADVLPEQAERAQGFRVLLSCSVKEAERVFAAFSDGGRVDFPLQKTFWTERFGMVTDRFGTPWMVSSE
jgi:PhnB protein